MEFIRVHEYNAHICVATCKHNTNRGVLMSKPWKVSLKELQVKAADSPLRRGMIVRCLPVGGSWHGFVGAEFYVLNDKASAMWGHPLAIRHCYDVDPNTAKMFAKGCDKDGNLMFHYTYLPANCVEVLNQTDWTDSNPETFLAEDAWADVCKKQAEDDRKAYERWKVRYEATDKQKDKNWMDLFARCLNENSWFELRKNQNGIFRPSMIDRWDPEVDNYKGILDQDRLVGSV